MKTLVLTVAPAFPPRTGGDLRNAAHIRAAAALGPVMAVSLAALRGPGAEQGIRREALSGRSEADCWRSPRGAPPGGANVTARDRDGLRALVRDFAPDTVIVEGIALAELIDAAAAGGAAIVIDMHNIESDLHAQIAASRTAAWLRPLRAARVARGRHTLEDIERRCATAAAMAWVCSGEDAARLKRIAPGARVEVVENSLPRPPAAGERTRAPEPDAPLLAFVGTMHYRPNVNAARVLAREIMPAVLRHCPGTRLTIAGRAPSRRVSALHDAPRVTVLADPDDAGAILETADFAVLPLTEGGGTRIKALEAMAAGLVLVATPLAVEGLGLRDGRDAVIRERPQELAAGVVRLARDAGAFLDLAGTGRAHAVSAGDPARHEARVAALLRRTVTGASAA